MEMENQSNQLPGDGMTAPQAAAPAIGPEQVKKMLEVLKKYKNGKTSTENRIKASENWWKLRNATMEQDESTTMGQKNTFRSESSWLHNVITSKHADAMAAYPEPNILPREEGDKAEARILSSIIPVILEQNDFESTYDEVMWQKGKSGTGAYKITWDASKLNGMGDISIAKVSLLNLFWEPGKDDIQESRYFFQTEMVDRDLVEEMYPHVGDLKGNSILTTQFAYDDSVSNEDKVTVVDCYYHKMVNGRRTLQYCKFVNDVVIYATENDTEVPEGEEMSPAERGLYDHGLYPFDFDPLFPIEGSPCGYGYVDICKNPQTTIDMLNTAFVKNAMVGAIPRYFSRSDGGINEEEFLDTSKPLVKITGSLGEESIREIPHRSLDGVYVNFLDRKIQELRETSGNTETATGSTSAGVTAASAIAALQEASGKGSKDATQASYRSYARIVKMIIELIRQFYNMPRQFRIVGQHGMEQFISYSNENLQLQHQGMAFGQDMGFRKPEFDIKVTAQKRNVYTKVSQNELALQFFQLGLFNPQMTDQAVMCLDMMDFDGRDDLIQQVQRNGTMFQKLVQYMQLALTLAAKSAPEMVEGLSQDVMSTMGVAAAGTATAGGELAGLEESENLPGGGKEKEHPIVEKARAKSMDSSQPDGGALTGGARG